MEERYLISKNLIDKISRALQIKSVSVAGENFSNVPALIEIIQAQSSGTSISPLTVSGQPIISVWVGTKAEYDDVDPVATTLYIITQ